MEREHRLGALPIVRQLILAGLTLYQLLLPRWKATKTPPKTNRSKGIIVNPIRLATCLDRSAAASGAIASMRSPCLPRRKLLSPAERLAPVEPPGAGVVGGSSDRSRRRGSSRLGDRWRVRASARGMRLWRWPAPPARRRASCCEGFVSETGRPRAFPPRVGCGQPQRPARGLPRALAGLLAFGAAGCADAKIMVGTNSNTYS